MKDHTLSASTVALSGKAQAAGMALAGLVQQTCLQAIDMVRNTPPGLLVVFAVSLLAALVSLLYVGLFVVAPRPRPARASEKLYRTVLPDGKVSGSIGLSCWQDRYLAQRAVARRAGRRRASDVPDLEPAEVFLSLVVPAYNEEERLGQMLEEAVDYLRQEYGVRSASSSANGAAGVRTGWEILIVSDGSTDGTVEVAMDFARKHEVTQDPSRMRQPEESIRVVSLEANRGKGGAVCHGMRHVRGQYVVFADADGATKFSDLGKVVRACAEAEDLQGRAVAVGSRAHLVGSEAVVKRSFLRNLLMHSFHLLLRLLTPPATAAIKDTQCGFKLFSRASLPYIVPYMHSEGWIFDVEMLMLAESVQIPVVEVPVGWREIKGSKLNVIWDSLGMAWGLAVLRGAWGLGIYRGYW